MTDELMTNTKYIFVSGGVISGLGKGITTASLSLLFKSCGYKVAPLKSDMYLNIDAGTMNPLEHGEVFVTDDGMETDEDLGHYERFLNQSLSGKKNYLTMGQIYNDVIKRERALDYKGKCVEGHIHVPEEIIRRVKEVGRGNDVVIVEVGGTVGEYQNVMFYEAIRRLMHQNPDDTTLVHLVYLPVPKFLGEMKSKPAQTSIYELYKLGIHPDFVVCRSEIGIDDKRKKTMSFNTGVREENIISAPDLDCVYKVPLVLRDQGFHLKLQKRLGLEEKPLHLGDWEKFVEGLELAKNSGKEIKVAIAGKYFASGDYVLEDSYICVVEAVKHACWKLGFKPSIQWFNIADFEDDKKRAKLETTIKNEYHGIIIPQGWGSRGVEGKIKAVEFARKEKIPFLGLCFGMQMAVIEYARNVLGLKNANTLEADPETPDPVIYIMPDQEKYLKERNYGGTIRLGSWPCKMLKGSVIEESYAKYAPGDIIDGLVKERHRHRYEVNNDYKKALADAGLVFSGTSPDGKLAEVVELSQSVHPFFVGAQFHPEYKSRPLSPHPLFCSFIEACLK
ncbi:MAG: CTP synthase [Patescibacteria group bacterium]